MFVRIYVDNTYVIICRPCYLYALRVSLDFVQFTPTESSNACTCINLTGIIETVLVNVPNDENYT